MKLYGYPNWVYSMFSFLGMLLVCIPLPWHLHAGNTGTVMYIFWAAISCLNAFVNSVVWTGNAINHAPVWCDISSRLIIAESVAIPAASLAINMNLYSISSSTRVGGKTKEEKRHQLVSDLLITIGIPVLSMVMYYIPQGHRFDIYEDVGCYPETYNTWVAFVCVYTWPLVISCISATYGVRSLWHFNKRRKDYNELLSARVNNNIDKNRYWRLMGLSSMDIVITIPMSCWALHTNAQQIEPWISWANTHTDFSRVVLYPGLIWRLSKLAYTALEATRWAYVMSAFIFFAFFGFGQEASSNYKKWYRFVAKYLRLPIPEWMKDPNETPRRFEASNK
ncbi:pheromone receptor [Fistulina hepatica ATCC 64428]|uniref:Pheromone receptor n=1 Tax=Fistulina hepatica ATCC 64428 TaxID=1128425 RepID=A0A0D7A3A0_9AGAR|nr:pheromone receptor [Fistulina hepatica ATCC 64428]